MEPLLKEPFELEYRGLDADKHTADALYIGQSITGIAKLYNSIIYWHFNGKIGDARLQDIRIHVGPAKEGSLYYLIYLMMVHGKLALYPEVMCELAGLVIPKAVRAIIARRSGQTKVMEKAVDAMLEMYNRHDDFARQVHADHVNTESKLLRVIEHLADVNRRPLSDMSVPVGRTVNQIEHFGGGVDGVTIDEPTAEALRSPEEARVGSTERYAGKLLAVDTVTGSCKLLLDGTAKPVRGKITDPALAVAENIYTHALDTQGHVTVTAKPVFKNDKLSTLYVSDAKSDKD